MNRAFTFLVFLGLGVILLSVRIHAQQFTAHGDSTSGLLIRGTLVNASWGDYDSDGYPDLFLRQGWGSWLDIYHNTGTGSFVRTTPGSGIADHIFSAGATWADINNDGLVDLVVLSREQKGSSTLYPTRLYKNLGEGQFVDIAAGTEFAIHGYGETPRWFDYDNDGDLDAVMHYYKYYVEDGKGNYVFRNEGLDIFSNVTAELSVSTPRNDEGVIVFDYDSDGDLDLVISGALFRNNGNATFTDVTLAAGLHGAFEEGAALGDLDNDGLLDLVLAEQTTGTSLHTTLYRNNGNGTFSDVTDIFGLPHTTNYGVGFVDFDNDGWQDLYVGSAPSEGSHFRLYRNNLGVAFEDVTDSSGIPGGIGRMTAGWADFDLDGDLDVIVTHSVMNNGEPVLFENHIDNGNSLDVSVTDQRGFTNQFGAEVRLFHANTHTLAAGVSAVGNSQGYLAQDQYPVHCGGDSTGLYDLEVTFPGSGHSGRLVVNKNVNSHLGSFRFSNFRDIRGRRIVEVRRDGSVVVNGVGYLPEAPSVVHLIAPAHSTSFVRTDSAYFSWMNVRHDSDTATHYEVAISRKSDFTNPTYMVPGVACTNLPAVFPSGGMYFWRARSVGVADTSHWSDTFRFYLDSTYTHVNRVPLFIGGARDTVREDSMYSRIIVALDTDIGDTVSYSLVGGSTWLSIDSVNGLLTGVPSRLDIATHETVTVRATDRNGGSSDFSMELVYVRTNHAPAFVTIPETSAQEDSLYSYVVHAFDADSSLFADVPRYRLVAGSDWMALDSISGLLSGVPVATDVGDAVAIVEAWDGMGASDLQQFTIHVVHTNHPPVFVVPDTVSAVEDSILSFAVGVSDVDSALFSDSLQLLVLTKPGWLTFTSDARRLSGIPGARDVGASSVALAAYDGKGGGDTVDITLLITHVNHSPSFTMLPLLDAVEDSLFSTIIFATDPDTAYFGDTVHYVLLSPGWLSVDSLTGRISGTPKVNDLADTTLHILAHDRSGIVVSFAACMTIKHVNHDPVFTTIPRLIAWEDSVYYYQMLPVDPDTILGDRIVTILAEAPAFLSVDSTSWLIEGTPAASDVGKHNVTVVLNDSWGGANQRSFVLDVHHVNHVPSVLSIPPGPAYEDSLYTYGVIAADPDSEEYGDVVRYRMQAPGWLFIDSTTGVITGTPGPAALGEHQVTVVVTDDAGAQGSQTYTLTVLHTNHAPVLGASSTHPTAREDEFFIMPLRVIDPDSALGDCPGIHLVSGPSWLVLDTVSESLRGTPREGDGDTSAVVVASDGALTDTLVLMIHVEPVNDPPMVSGLPDMEFDEDATETLALGGAVVDPDDPTDALVWSVGIVEETVPVTMGPVGSRRQPVHGGYRIVNTRGGHLDVTIDPVTASALFSASPDFSCDRIMVVFTATDPGGLSGRDTIAVTVRPVNDAPVIARIPDVSFPEDSSATIDLSRYISDVDDPQPTLAISVVVHESLLVALDRPTSRLTISAPHNFWCPPVPVGIVVTDPAGSVSRDTFLVSITPVNDPPALGSLPPVSFEEDDSLFVPFTMWEAAALDPDDPVATLHWIVGGTHHVDAQMQEGGVLIHAGHNWSGTDSLVVRVVDAGGLEGSTQLHVTVNEVNDPPRLRSLPDTLLCTDFRYAVSLREFTDDPDDTLFSYSVVGPSWVQIDTSDVLHMWPDQAGEYALMVLCADSWGVTDTARLHVRVTANDGADDLTGALPRTFLVRQNYPNPFNPTTTIRFGTPTRAHVRLAVYNLLGQEVCRILDDEVDAGYHEATWVGRDNLHIPVSAGVYFYHILALVNGETVFNEVRKMVYLK